MFSKLKTLTVNLKPQTDGKKRKKPAHFIALNSRLHSAEKIFWH